MERRDARRRDYRPLGVGLALVLIALLGALFSLSPRLYHLAPEPVADAPAPPERIDPAQDPAGHVEQARSAEVRQRFGQAVLMLHAGQFEYAVTALHRVLELAPRMPEAHVNMGFALLGQEDYKSAHDFFLGAIELRPGQANAYYGLAAALEGVGEMEGARGAMRTFIHLADPNDPFISKARSALWEWEQAHQSAVPAEDAPVSAAAAGEAPADPGR